MRYALIALALALLATPAVAQVTIPLAGGQLTIGAQPYGYGQQPCQRTNAAPPGTVYAYPNYNNQGYGQHQQPQSYYQNGYVYPQGVTPQYQFNYSYGGPAGCVYGCTGE